MASRVTGTVKWFNHTRGYGFVETDDGTEVFVHHNDIEMDGYRYLRRGQVVSFQLLDEGDGPKAGAVRIEQDAPVRQTQSAEPVGDDSEAFTPFSYRFNQIIQVEEDREHEFKSVRKSRDPVKTITEYYVEKYVNAFLNTNGGTIYFGIDDDGRVHGIRLERAERDRLRTLISKQINRFQPAVEPELYEIRFIPVADRESTYVLQLKVEKGAANLYMTGSQNFFLRRDGSNFLMPFDMIRARLQAPPRTPALPEPKSDELQPEIQGLVTRDLDLGILLAMVFMSWSDSQLSETEVHLIQERARDEGLDEEEVNVLLQAIVRPPLLETIVTYLPTPEARKAAATIAYLTALSDNVLTADELQAFDKMCDALGLSPREREEIRKLGETQMRQG